jgi:hypothetical protein
VSELINHKLFLEARQTKYVNERKAAKNSHTNVHTVKLWFAEAQGEMRESESAEMKGKSEMRGVLQLKLHGLVCELENDASLQCPIQKFGQ